MTPPAPRDLCVLAALVLAAAPPAAAAGGAGAGPVAGGEREDALERGHSAVEDSLLDFIDGIDRFFGTDNYAANTNESFLRLAPGVRFRGDGEVSFRPRVRANLQLPRTERRLGLVLGGRNDEDLLDGDGEDDEGFGAGLRAALLDDRATKLRFAVGSRFRPEPDPFVRFRLQHTQPWGRVAVRPSVTGFWELRDGLGERTRLDLDYGFGPRWLGRLRGEATYGESTEGVELRAAMYHFFSLGERSAWSAQIRMDAHTRPRTEIVEYRALLRYRWSMLRPWLFFEIEPAVRARRRNDFDPAPEATFRVEIAFGSERGLIAFPRAR